MTTPSWVGATVKARAEWGERDSDRRDFIQAYQKFGLKDLKWMGSYTQKAISSEAEVDASLKGMMTIYLV